MSKKLDSQVVDVIAWLSEQKPGTIGRVIGAAGAIVVERENKIAEVGDNVRFFASETCDVARHKGWPHGSGVVAEVLPVQHEDQPLLVSDDGSHLYFRGNVYRLEVGA